VTTFAIVLDGVGCLLAAHTVVNALLLRRAPRHASVDEQVSLLLPVRDEAHRVAPSLQALLGQQGLRRCEVLVYDDCSGDGTVDVVRRIAGDRVTVVTGGALPSGWLGKPHACAGLAEAACGSVLVFVDADVVLEPDAVAAAVTLLRERRLQWVSPYPRQLARSWLERLVQPLLQWSWLTFLPLRVAERSHRPSLAAANGQFLVVDAAAYRDAGGHAAVRDDVVEDMALARALRRTGAHGGFVDGRDLATCRMYDGSRDLVDGYAKSLWRAFGSPSAAAGVAALLLVTGVVPWLLVALTPVAWPAAVAGPAGRLVAAVRAGSRPWPDAVLHPLSVIAFVVLVAVSVLRRRRGRLTWKARAVA
jgi:glycosyltransferase involved in cell wall biosynthesis